MDAGELVYQFLAAFHCDAIWLEHFLAILRKCRNGEEYDRSRDGRHGHV